MYLCLKTIKINGARAMGVLLTESEIYSTYNLGDSMKFDGYKYSAWLDNDYEGYHYNLEIEELAIDRSVCDQTDK